MTTPANYLESYANHKLVMVHRADLEEWAKLTAAPAVDLSREAYDHLSAANAELRAEIARLKAFAAEDDAWRTAINVMVPSAGDGKSCLQRAVEKINELKAKGSK